MDEQEQHIEVHAYFVRFKSECYYALIVGKRVKRSSGLQNMPMRRPS